MTRILPGYLPVVVAVLLTVLLGTVFSVVMGNDQLVDAAVLGILALMSLLAPFVVTMVWVWALLGGRPHRLVLIGAALWLVAGMVMMPAEVTWSLTTHVVSGLVAGLGLVSRWKPGLILWLLILISLPLVLWNLNQEPMDEMFQILKEQNLQARRELLMAGTRPGAEPPALVQEEQMFDDLILLVGRLTPGSVALGLLFQAALTFGLIWLLVRMMGLTAGLRGFPPFGRWRLPFSVVWALAVAGGLMIIPLPWWPYAGANLALVAVSLLAVQGATVQWCMTAIGIPMLLRLFLMFMAGMLFLPLVLLGLADQWLDFRKLDAEESTSQ